MDEGRTVDWNPLRADMNGDGQLTLSDAGLWLTQAFFLPGDCLLWAGLTYAPGVTRFLELSSADYGGVFSGVVAALSWFLAVVIVGAGYTFVRDVDRAFTAHAARFGRELRRRWRVARTLVLCRLREVKLRLPSIGRGPQPDMDLGELELSDLELEVLRSHAYLAPGFVYTASDIASALGIRRGQARQVLQKLRRLQLLDSALSASDGENGYRLSRPGQFLLMARGGPQTG